MKTLIIFLCLAQTSCSLVQWLPSSNCEYVQYVRIKNHVAVRAECDV